MTSLVQISGEVRQFPYRTAFVVNEIAILPRELLQDLEYQLARQARVGVNNHTVYEVDQGKAHPIYLMFTDSSVRIGYTIQEKQW